MRTKALQARLPLEGGTPSPVLPYQVPELKVLRLSEYPVDWRTVDKPDQVACTWREAVEKAPWYDQDKECLVVFLLNTRKRLLGFHLVTLGTLDTCHAHPREVFRVAIAGGAQAIVLAHNHPSGEASPSEADIKVTRDLIRAGQILKIELLDHVIVGKPDPSQAHLPGWVSLRELGYFYS
jgi:DNA repair protein RadC